jgi:hypothetical protein
MKAALVAEQTLALLLPARGDHPFPRLVFIPGIELPRSCRLGSHCVIGRVIFNVIASIIAHGKSSFLKDCIRSDTAIGNTPNIFSQGFTSTGLYAPLKSKRPPRKMA